MLLMSGSKKHDDDSNMSTTLSKTATSCEHSPCSDQGLRLRDLNQIRTYFLEAMRFKADLAAFLDEATAGIGIR